MPICLVKTNDISRIIYLKVWNSTPVNMVIYCYTNNFFTQYKTIFLIYNLSILLSLSPINLYSQRHLSAIKGVNKYHINNVFKYIFIIRFNNMYILYNKFQHHIKSTMYKIVRLQSIKIYLAKKISQQHTGFIIILTKIPNCAINKATFIFIYWAVKVTNRYSRSPLTSPWKIINVRCFHLYSLSH